MRPQNFQLKSEKICADYLTAKSANPKRFAAKLNLSWSNWGFGIEPLQTSLKRLADNGIKYIELHGNRYGADLGYKSPEVRTMLDDYGISVSGICGMFSEENDLSSNSGISRQNAIDYIKRNVELGSELGARYFLIVPGAVGRPSAYDDTEVDRSIETLALVADVFTQSGIRGAVEPIRSAEVSIIHTFDAAEDYIARLNHPGVQHINGDVYHMLVEESHISETIVQHGPRLTNLHLADTNRSALGDGSLDVDTLIMALYLIGYNNNCFCTPEPLGPGGDPYPAMFGRPDSALLDALVSKTASYWRGREEVVRSGESEQL
ncbi:MAG: sugar phosphate isomerase/epimerase family protein [Armatimonadota bacterium]